MKKEINFDDIKRQWMQNSEFKKVYNELEIEYQISLELIKARTSAGLSQTEVASIMGTTQSVIARLESGKTLPNMKTLYRYAEATGNQVHLNLTH